jgi:hypothetical protein
MFLRKAEGDTSQHSWPDLSDDALAAQREAAGSVSHDKPR